MNLLDSGGWRLGPSGMLRFGRSDVEDDVVDRVHEIDPSIDLGAFAGYTWVDRNEPRFRVGTTAWVLADVTDSHGGWTAGANVFGAYPVLKALTLIGGGAFTYGSGSYMSTYFGVTPADSQASGLSVYQPDAGSATCEAGWCPRSPESKLDDRWRRLLSWLADEAGRSPSSRSGARDTSGFSAPARCTCGEAPVNGMRWVLVTWRPAASIAGLTMASAAALHRHIDLFAEYGFDPGVLTFLARGGTVGF